eukprot:1998872-Pleurochrysis_carterae.AAC.1
MSRTSVRVVWTACALTTAVCCVTSPSIAFIAMSNKLSNRPLPLWLAQANAARRKSACEPIATDNRRTLSGLATSLNPFALELSSLLARSARS